MCYWPIAAPDLELKSADSTTGFITIRLSVVDNALAGTIVNSNARQDIEHSNVPKSASLAQSRPMQAISAANSFLQHLQNVISKLDMFVHIVDKTSKVSLVGIVRNLSDWGRFIHMRDLHGKCCHHCTRYLASSLIESVLFIRLIA